jgi:NAD+ synthase (glutamine-hydrolysing)
MKNGFIKVSAATPEIRVADCDYNANQITILMKEANNIGAKLLVLPELCISGYTCGDLFLQSTLLNGALNALNSIVEESSLYDLVTIIGIPLVKGSKLYNCAVVVKDGDILGVIPKTHIPNYGEFYEYRHFTPAPLTNSSILINGKEYPFGTKLLFECTNMSTFCIGVEICEDIWVPNPPSTLHALAGATVIVNLSASNEAVGKDTYRRELVKSQSASLICSYIYSSAGEGESTTDLVFSGHNLISEYGSILAESKLFENSLIFSEIDIEKLNFERRRHTTFMQSEDNKYEKIYFTSDIAPTALTRSIPMHPFIPTDINQVNERSEVILSIQSYGLKKRISHACANTAVIGISGGLDSCLALLVTVRTMDLLKRPHSDIIAVTMPGFGTTSRTKGNAEKMCEALGVTLKCIDISESVITHFTDIDHDLNNHNVVYENAQARERTQILMDIANQTNGLVIGTGDLSELALGWATYNGDHMSMYGVNSSIPKTLIRHIVNYCASISTDNKLKKVLLDILDTPVSPELLPTTNGEMSQITEDLVGPYELHDFFLYYGIRWCFSPAKVFYLACYSFHTVYDKEVILKWLKVFYRRFFSQQFKRSCLPDGPKVGSSTLSPRGDWRMPSDASAALWLAELDTLK